MKILNILMSKIWVKNVLWQRTILKASEITWFRFEEALDSLIDIICSSESKIDKKLLQNVFENFRG